MLSNWILEEMVMSDNFSEMSLIGEIRDNHYGDQDCQQHQQQKPT
jgi:hypothetical protein